MTLGQWALIGLMLLASIGILVWAARALKRGQK